MTGLTISRGAALAIWGHETPLFQRYNYWNRLSEGEPLPEPITEFREALVLLYEEMNDKTRRFINTDGRLSNQKKSGPVLCIEIYGSGYTREEFSRSYDFPITAQVVEELKHAGVLSGIKQWGTTDQTLLRLNEQSVERILEEIQKYSDEQKSIAEHVPEPNND